MVTGLKTLGFKGDVTMLEIQVHWLAQRLKENGLNRSQSKRYNAMIKELRLARNLLNNEV